MVSSKSSLNRELEEGEDLNNLSNSIAAAGATMAAGIILQWHLDAGTTAIGDSSGSPKNALCIWEEGGGHWAMLQLALGGGRGTLSYGCAQCCATRYPSLVILA